MITGASCSTLGVADKAHNELNQIDVMFTNCKEFRILCCSPVFELVKSVRRR